MSMPNTRPRAQSAFATGDMGHDASLLGLVHGVKARGARRRCARGRWPAARACTHHRYIGRSTAIMAGAAGLPRSRRACPRTRVNALHAEDRGRTALSAPAPPIQGRGCEARSTSHATWTLVVALTWVCRRRARRPRPAQAASLGAALLEAREPVSAAAAMCMSDFVPVSGFARYCTQLPARPTGSPRAARALFRLGTPQRTPRILGDPAQSRRHTL
jgi:hypothetical protein